MTLGSTKAVCVCGGTGQSAGITILAFCKLKFPRVFGEDVRVFETGFPLQQDRTH